MTRWEKQTAAALRTTTTRTKPTTFAIDGIRGKFTGLLDQIALADERASQEMSLLLRQGCVATLVCEISQFAKKRALEIGDQVWIAGAKFQIGTIARDDVSATFGLREA